VVTAGIDGDGPGTSAPGADVADPPARRVRVPAWWPVLVPVVIVLAGAWTYRWVDEDAFINFRVIHNLLAGHGPVFNIGERVEVDSDPLWMGVLAVLHAITPWASIEWTSVVLGLTCTAGGFVAGGAAVARLGARHDEGTVLPLGLLVVSVVAGVWEFATSGLEMSMVFLWLGVSFLLLVRVEARRSGAVRCAVVFGLGTLIRPELLLASVVLMAALVTLMASPEWSSASGRVRRCLAPIGAALALPVAYELFRMAYYALLVPSTALAKAAGSSWWSQGATYLWNFVAPYTLWIPMALAFVLVAARMANWWRAGDRSGVLVLCTPVVVGVVQAVYVVGIGGDYMHARLLLPAFFALCLPVYAGVRSLRGALVVPAVAIGVWSVVCLGWLRFVPPVEHALTPQTVFISNERDSWVAATGSPHPVTAADYARALSGRAGRVLARAARAVPPGHQEILVVTNPFAPIDPATAVPARSPLPFTLAVNLPAIGVIGYLAGPDVYVYDSFSLANPIGSHTTVLRHARPGHEKLIGPSWMLGRFGVPGTTAVSGGPSAASVVAARAALRCDPLHAYLVAVTAPLTVGRMLSNMGASLGFTTMQFSADPVVAVTQLCGPGTAR
jgi:arabinofuranosyltransferase